MAAGSITWELLMKTASFETDSKRAEKRIKDLKKEAEELGKTMGVAVVAGATALTYALKQSVDMMDEFSKAAQSLGTSTETISSLAYVASLADVEFTQLSKALVKLTSDAPETKAALSAIGVSTKDLTTGGLKDLPSLLGDVADKFAGYRDGAEKTALAVSIFGEKIGPKLIPLLNGGRVGIADLTAEAKRLGVVIDTETGKAAEQFNDNLTRLGAAVRGVANDMTSTLLPVLNDAIENFIRGRKAGLGFFEAFTGIGVRGINETLADSTANAGKHIKELTVEIEALTEKKAKLQATTKKGGLEGLFAGAVNLEYAKIDDDIKALKAKKKYFQEVRLASKEFQEVQFASLPQASYSNEGRGVSQQAAPDVAAITEREKARIAALKEAAKEAAKARKEIESELKRARKEIEDEGKRLTESVQTPAEKLAGTKANVGKLADAGVISPDTQQRALADAEAAYQEHVQAQRDMLTEGLLSEEDEIAKSYERRKQMILALTEATEAEKADAIASLSEKAELDQAAARLNRYRDLLDQETVVTADYQARRREIENDETLGAEERTQYLISLSEKYHARMDELDAETQAKKDAAFKAQIDLVSSGFAGAAELAKAFAGEQSGVYKAMFAASKAFAVADIAIKQAQAIAKAWGENNYFVAAGLTVGLAAQFASLISSASSASFGGTRADGGSVNEGRSYLVGERGPEMFTPTAGGTIIPNDALQGGQQPAANIRIVNAFDNAVIGDYMGSSDGERLVMNAVRRNQGAIRQLVSA